MKNRKGIILAGGSGTRLYPVTKCVSKQLLPVYNKPMIYYPLSVLMLSGIRDILIITTPHDKEAFQRILGDGSWLGINIEYAVQPSPDGLAQAFIIGEDFIGNNPSALILGDNLFYGHDLVKYLQRASSREHGATIFGYHVKDPERYGVAGFNVTGEVTELVEKPEKAPSSFAITGLYFYDQQVVDFAKTLKPSKKGELEITDLNKVYLEHKQLYLEKLGRGFAWLDTGTFESYLHACNYVEAIEARQGIMIACPEEIAFTQGFIDVDSLYSLGKEIAKSSYGEYLMQIAKEL